MGNTGMCAYQCTLEWRQQKILNRVDSDQTLYYMGLYLGSTYWKIVTFPYDSYMCFCGRVPWLYQYWLGEFMLFVVLCPGTPEGSTGSGSGFKATQKTGQWLKVSCKRYSF